MNNFNFSNRPSVEYRIPLNFRQKHPEIDVLTVLEHHIISAGRNFAVRLELCEGVLANLITARDIGCVLHYSRSETVYRQGVRYRGITLGLATRVVADFVRSGYCLEIVADPGFGGVETTLIPTNLLDDIARLAPLPISKRKQTPLELRDANRIELKIPNTLEAKQISEEVGKINQAVPQIEYYFPDGTLTTHSITLIESDGKFQFVDLSNNQYTAIANLDLAHGCRLYRHAMQLLSKKLRLMARINGEPVIEADFGEMHLRIAYNLVGEEPPSDGYSLDLDLPVEDARKFIKRSVFILINANSRIAGINAIAKNLMSARRIRLMEAGKGGPYKSERMVAAKVYDGLMQRHRPISEFFCTGAGLKFQRIDSDIMRTALLALGEQEIGCVGVHDSIVAPVIYCDEVRQAMEDAVGARLGNKQLFPIDVSDPIYPPKDAVCVFVDKPLYSISKSPVLCPNSASNPVDVAGKGGRRSVSRSVRSISFSSIKKGMGKRYGISTKVINSFPKRLQRDLEQACDRRRQSIN